MYSTTTGFSSLYKSRRTTFLNKRGSSRSLLRPVIGPGCTNRQKKQWYCIASFVGLLACLVVWWTGCCCYWSSKSIMRELELQPKVLVVQNASWREQTIARARVSSSWRTFTSDDGYIFFLILSSYIMQKRMRMTTWFWCGLWIIWKWSSMIRRNSQQGNDSLTIGCRISGVARFFPKRITLCSAARTPY